MYETLSLSSDGIIDLSTATGGNHKVFANKVTSSRWQPIFVTQVASSVDPPHNLPSFAVMSVSATWRFCNTCTVSLTLHDDTNHAYKRCYCTTYIHVRTIFNVQ